MSDLVRNPETRFSRLTLRLYCQLYFVIGNDFDTRFYALCQTVSETRF